jgi:hypothetical protein
MRKYLLGLFAIVLAVGFSAFTPTTHKAKGGLTTYHAIKTGTTTWIWDTTIPEGFTCRTESGAPLCDVDVVSQPAANTVPSGYTADGHFYK